MSCETYKTDKGLQIGGIDPRLAVKSPKYEAKTEVAEVAEEIIVEEEKPKKAVKKPVKKTTKRFLSILLSLLIVSSCFVMNFSVEYSWLP